MLSKEKMVTSLVTVSARQMDEQWMAQRQWKKQNRWSFRFGFFSPKNFLLEEKTLGLRSTMIVKQDAKWLASSWAAMITTTKRQQRAKIKWNLTSRQSLCIYLVIAVFVSTGISRGIADNKDHFGRRREVMKNLTKVIFWKRASRSTYTQTLICGDSKV